MMENNKKYGATTYLNTHMQNPDAPIGNQRADVRTTTIVNWTRTQH